MGDRDGGPLRWDPSRNFDCADWFFGSPKLDGTPASIPPQKRRNGCTSGTANGPQIFCMRKPRLCSLSLLVGLLSNLRTDLPKAAVLNHRPTSVMAPKKRNPFGNATLGQDRLLESQMLNEFFEQEGGPVIAEEHMTGWVMSCLTVG